MTGEPHAIRSNGLITIEKGERNEDRRARFARAKVEGSGGELPARRGEHMWAILLLVVGASVTMVWLGAIAFAIDFVAERL
jgi:hypothetical protein